MLLGSAALWVLMLLSVLSTLAEEEAGKSASPASASSRTACGASSPGWKLRSGSVMLLYAVRVVHGSGVSVCALLLDGNPLFCRCLAETADYT